MTTCALRLTSSNIPVERFTPASTIGNDPPRLAAVSAPSTSRSKNVGSDKLDRSTGTHDVLDEFVDRIIHHAIPGVVDSDQTMPDLPCRFSTVILLDDKQVATTLSYEVPNIVDAGSPPA